MSLSARRSALFARGSAPTGVVLRPLGIGPALLHFSRAEPTVTPDSVTLLNTLEKHDVGETVTVTVQRDGETLDVPVTLQAQEP